MAPIETHIELCVSALTKMVGGAWRRPRMKVYDYNQEFGGNYYQVSGKILYGHLSTIMK